MNEQVRLSDAEREEAARSLGEHFAHGRLTAEEHSERMDQVWAARTYADLPPLFRDLPGGSPLHAAPARQATRLPYAGRPGRPPLWAVLRVVLIVAIVATVITHLPFILLGIAIWWVLRSVMGRGACRTPRGSWAR